MSINRIRLEFKGSSVPGSFTSVMRINRIRLEFKVLSGKNGRQRLIGINRIRLEFKDFGNEDMGILEGVLIESDWNLKLNVGRYFA